MNKLRMVLKLIKNMLQALSYFVGVHEVVVHREVGVVHLGIISVGACVTTIITTIIIMLLL